MNKIGIYIHIPFCIKKWLYCDFVSYSDKKDIQEQYMKSLKKEIENWLKQNQDIEIVKYAINEYVKNKQMRDLPKLMEYAKTFNVEEALNNYLEFLMW